MKMIYTLLNKLIDTSLVDVYRTLDLCCFQFKKDNQVYNIHIQCTWRLIVNNTIFATLGDIYISDLNNEIRFDCIRKLIPTTLIVKYVNVSELGDITINLCDSSSNKQWTLSTFSDSSVEEELWRFIEVGINKKHLVCYPSKIQLE